jgi:hypothetical protein
MCGCITTHGSKALTFNPNKHTDRLFGAADVLFKAMKLNKGKYSLIPIRFDVPQPDAAATTPGYTLKELLDAMTMLIRMGIVPAEHGIDAASCGVGGDSLNPRRRKPPAATARRCRRRYSPLCVVTNGIGVPSVCNVTLN